MVIDGWKDTGKGDIEAVMRVIVNDAEPLFGFYSAFVFAQCVLHTSKIDRLQLRRVLGSNSESKWKTEERKQIIL